MSRAAEASLAFAGEDRIFRLSLGRLRALQEKVDCGPMELLSRYATGAWRVDDLREVIYQGLVGGGLDAAAASRLMKTDFDDLPLAPFVVLARGIVLAAVVGAGDEVLGEAEGEVVKTPPSPEESSGSAPSTEAEPP